MKTAEEEEPGLSEFVGAILTQLMERGWEHPIYMTMIGANGVMTFFCAGPGMPRLAGHHDDDETDVKPPINLVFTDAKGAFAHVQITASGPSDLRMN